MSNPKTTIFLFTNGKPFKPPVKIEAELEQIQNKLIQEREGKLWYECQNLYDMKGNIIKKIGKIKKDEIFVIVHPDCKFVPGKYKEFHNKYIKGISSELLDAETYCNRAMASPRLKVIMQKTPRGCQEYIPKSVAPQKDIAIKECTPRSGTRSKKKSTSCWNKKKELPKYPALRTKTKKDVCPKTLRGGNLCPNSGGRKKKRKSGMNCCKKRPATYRKPYIPRHKRKTPRNIVGETPRKGKVSKKNKNWFNCWPFNKKKKAPRHVYCDLDCKENRKMKRRFESSKQVQTDFEENDLKSPTAQNVKNEKSEKRSEIKTEVKLEKKGEQVPNPPKALNLENEKFEKPSEIKNEKQPLENSIKLEIEKKREQVPHSPKA